MGGMRANHVAAGTRVKVKDPGPVPQWSTWDDDGQRTSNSVKKKIQSSFFAGDRRISGEVIYISSETERDRLRNAGRVKVQLRDSAGSMIVVTAPSSNLLRQ